MRLRRVIFIAGDSLVVYIKNSVGFIDFPGGFGIALDPSRRPSFPRAVWECLFGALRRVCGLPRLSPV
jgi:hypothetical protein